MQESEPCQKALASLKADLPFKADASAMGSAFPSAGTRNETVFHVCVLRGLPLDKQALMKPLSGPRRSGAKWWHGVKTTVLGRELSS